MNWRTTVWLTGAALVLALFIRFVEQPARLARHRTTVAPRVVPRFDPATIAAIEVQAPGESTVRLVKTNGLWRIASLDLQPAQQQLADGLLQRVAALRGQSILTTAELRARPQAAAEFGLNPPVASVTLVGPSGPTELLLGVRSIQGTQVYCQVVGIPGIFAADADLADLLPLRPDGWRETTLIPLDRLVFDRIRVDPQGAPFTLARNSTNGLWSLIEPRVARADPNRVGILIRRLGFMQIQDFVAPTSAPPPELTGLKPPRLTVSLARGSNEVFGVSIGGPVTNAPTFYAQRPGDRELLTVPAETTDLLRVSYKDLLDRRILRFDPAALREIEFAGGESFRLSKVAENWRILPDDIPADATLVERLLSTLAALEIIDIAKEVVTDLDLATYGLAPPAGRLTLRSTTGDTNTTAAVLEFGALLDNRRFARVQGEPPVYLLNPADLDVVPSAAWQLRDRTVWRFDSTQVSAITIRNADLEWTVRRQGTNDWTVPPGLRNDINPFALDEALHVAGSSRALSWIAFGDSRNQAFGIGRGPELTLELRGNDSTNQIRVSFGKHSPGGNRYVATTLSDGSQLTFELPGHACDDLLRELGVTADPGSQP
ncbi:MAG: DUF4340 domain-containing protein [Limisphaerales bacterium]